MPRLTRLCAPLVAALLSANAALSDSYQGLTIGDPVPDLGTLPTAELWGERAGGATLAAPLSTICTHVLLSGGQGAIYGDTANGCDGPVLRIRAVEPVHQFTDPADGRGFKMHTGLTGLSFHTTTLSDLRALFGSEGLTGGRFGLQTPDFINAYVLAYGLSGSDTLAVFTFQNPLEPMPLTTDESPAPQTRDAALLFAIDLISPQFFDIIGDVIPTTPSENYTPIHGVFTE